MLKTFLGLLLLSFTLSGCAVRIVPEAVPGGVIAPDGKSISISKGDLTISAGVVDEEVFNNTQGLITSMRIEIENRGDREESFDNDSFVLVDGENMQHFSVAPEKVRQMLTKETYYLLPYPYVGFYYLEDYEKAAFRNSTNTALPYYYELYPEALFAKALPMESIIPKAKIGGLLYFQMDLHSQKSFRLHVYRKGSSKSAPADFVFPFVVAK